MFCLIVRFSHTDFSDCTDYCHRKQRWLMNKTSRMAGAIKAPTICAIRKNLSEKEFVSICVICGAKKHFRKFRIFSSFPLCPPMSVRIPLAASFLASRNATTIPAGRKSIFNSFSSSVHLTRGLFRRRGRARCRVRRRKRGGQ